MSTTQNLYVRGDEVGDVLLITVKGDHVDFGPKVDIWAVGAFSALICRTQVLSVSNCLTVRFFFPLRSNAIERSKVSKPFSPSQASA
jgi:hypothetical protein